MEAVQFKAALARNGAIGGFSKEKLCQEFCLESNQQRWWYRILCCFDKIPKIILPNYLHKLVPVSYRSYRTRHWDTFPVFKVKHIFFGNTSFSLSKYTGRK